MKITRQQLRRIISESMKFTGGGKSIDQARGDMKSAFSGYPNLDGWKDLTDLETTLDQLLSYEGQRLYEKAFGRGSYRPIHRDFDAYGIFNGGENIIAALERLGLEQSVDSIYRYVLEQWADKNTAEGIFTELSAEDYFNQQGI
tara:strand:+ start:206 stop:637 length:432 start_codon:yes stop_codon:yes gene_type:complete